MFGIHATRQKLPDSGCRGLNRLPESCCSAQIGTYVSFGLVSRRRQSRKSRKSRQPRHSLNMREICMPRDFKNLAESCVCNESIVTGTKLGSGAYGSVYHVVRSGNTRYALKVQKNNAYIKCISIGVMETDISKTQANHLST